ncbi:MAG TPA: hypothetical protein VGR41_03640 [Actinomycetota bacterium]|nr:hypothetical protein [Actinomycetota bacterium]
MGLSFFVGQVTLALPGRSWSWDEAIYLSQVMPGSPHLPWAPSRARGITYLVLPLVRGGLGATAIRVTLGLLAAGAVVLAYRGWSRDVGRTALLAAALFAGSWIALYYGGAVMPNLWIAICAVGATGLALRTRTVGSTALLAATIAAAALLRPLDSIPIAIACCVITPRKGNGSRILAIAAGVLAGLAPWIIEMSARFGGPVEALRAAGRVGHVGVEGVGLRLQRYLSLADGALIAPVSSRASIAVVVSVAVFAALAVLGVLSARGTEVFRPLAVVAMAGAALLALYIFFVGGIAPRFMLPALALLALPVAHGILALAMRRELRIAIAAALVVWIGWQATIVRTVATREEALQRPFAQAGLDISRSVPSESCFVMSVRNFPQIAYRAGCDGTEAPITGAELAELVQRARLTFAQVFLVTAPDVVVAGCLPEDTIATPGIPLTISRC